MSVDRSRIIVCDDQKDMALTLAQLLRFCGYEVFSCFTGAACLAKAREWMPFAAVIDIGLPGITGYDVARSLRRLAEGENMLLLAVTGYVTKTNIEDAQLAGFDWHFPKPAPPSSILEVLRNPEFKAEYGTRL
jgi:CheY-like chemotaxis protein